MKQTNETLEIAGRVDWASKISDEINRILKSGAIDTESYSRGMLIGVALENLSENYLRGDKNTKEYRNMKRI